MSVDEIKSTTYLFTYAINQFPAPCIIHYFLYNFSNNYIYIYIRDRVDWNNTKRKSTPKPRPEPKKPTTKPTLNRSGSGHVLFKSGSLSSRDWVFMLEKEDVDSYLSKTKGLQIGKTS